MSNSSSRLIGLDIGGSKTHAIAAWTDGDGGFREHGLDEVLAGSANLSSVGVAEATRQLASVFDQLGRDGVGAVCAGAAGVDTPEQEDRLRRLIQSQVPGAAVRIVHDTHLILAAADVPHGIALISGTGSVAWGRTDDGRTARAGGWGYLLGDEGSGYWIGLQAVRHALGQVDRGEHPDLLAQRLAADCGLQEPGELLDHFYANPERRYWAGQSRLVFELARDGHAAAARIVEEACGALNELVRIVAGRLALTGPVVIGGGLIVHQPMTQTILAGNLTAAEFHDIRFLANDPVYGALNLARELTAAGAGLVQNPGSPAPPTTPMNTANAADTVDASMAENIGDGHVRRDGADGEGDQLEQWADRPPVEQLPREGGQRGPGRGHADCQHGLSGGGGRQ